MHDAIPMTKYVNALETGTHGVGSSAPTGQLSDLGQVDNPHCRKKGTPRLLFNPCQLSHSVILKIKFKNKSKEVIMITSVSPFVAATVFTIAGLT